MDVDEQIGQRLTEARGEMSQKELARLMAVRGWKWSQATVWSVEQGKRPLRLSEAVDLAWILHIELKYLLTDERAMWTEIQTNRAFEALERVREETERAIDVLVDLARQVDDHELGGDIDERVMDLLRRTPISVAREQTVVVTRRYMENEPELAPYLETSGYVKTALDQLQRDIGDDIG